MTQEDWISAHLFYHQDLRVVLTDCVRPLIDTLRAEESIKRFFFIRYWQGGPHIRLRLLPTNQTGRERIQQKLEQHVSKFLTAYPAMQQMQEEEYRQAAVHFSRFEYGQPDDTPLYPNNSLQYIPYVPEYHRYGGRAAMPIVERHFMESSEVVLDLLGQTMTHNQRTGLALSMMLSGLSQYTDEPNELAKLFESYFRWSRPVFGDRQAAYTEQFGMQYQKQDQRLQKLVVQVLSPQGNDRNQENSLLSAWARSLSTLKQALCQQALQTDAPHRRLKEHAPLFSETHPQSLPGILLSCLHMHNNRLGISLFDEAYLAFLLYKSLSALQHA
ncbi:MAG TPA: thiopeptide-type bacteriocin biosynthesis protein [Ktedonobacteraceae bacterium]|nr:thiopeptide-type bacteriocin biosynthesis protein [Ktedonobacteraceae bacterium]